MEYLTTLILATITILVIISYIKFIKYEPPEGEIKDPYHAVSKTYDVIIFLLIAATALSYIHPRVQAHQAKIAQSQNVANQNQSNKELTKK